MYIIATRKVKH